MARQLQDMTWSEVQADPRYQSANETQRTNIQAKWNKLQPALDNGQDNSVGNVVAGAGRIAAGIPVSLANTGVAVGNSVLSAGAWLGNKLGIGDGTYTPIPKAGYGSADAVLAPRGVYEQAGSDIGAGLITAPLVASRAAPAATRVGRVIDAVAEGAAQTAPQAAAAHNQGTTDDSVEMLKDIAVGGVAGGAFHAAQSGIQKGARVVRESLGEITPEVAARQANPEYVNRVATGGEDYQSVIRDAEGNVIINPNQALNPETQPSLIRAQQREQKRLGEASEFTQRMNKQKSAESLTATARKMDNGENVQAVAQDIHQAFKNEAKVRYDAARQQAQNVLDEHGVSQIGLADTKQAARDLLSQHDEMGGQLFNSETVSMLKSMENVKFKDLKTLDKWKTTLSNRAQKAQISGDYDSANALRDLRSKMLNEFDAHLNSLDESAGNTYREADRYYRDHVEDFGKKSLTGKMMDAKNPDRAANMLVRGQDAVYNTQDVMSALEAAKTQGTIPNAQQLQERLAKAIGDENRRMSVEHTERLANSQMNPNQTTLGNDLLKGRESLKVADRFAGTNETGKIDTLQSGIDTYRSAAKPLGKSNMERASSWVGAAAGGAAGQMIHPVGGALGAMGGKRLVDEMWSSGLLDNLARRSKRGVELVDYLSNPENAAKVQQILQSGYGKPIHDASVQQVQDAVRIATGGFFNADEPDSSSVQRSPGRTPYRASQGHSEAISQPVQHAQATKTPRQTFEKRTTNLYHALAHAETGGLKNRFIRTKADEREGVSTAYGPAQITKTLMQDFVKRHGSQLTPAERRYAEAFIRQGNRMLHADKNDKVYGHGGTGILNGKNAQARYADIARKMLDTSLKEHHGDVLATVRAWRGKHDAGYESKVMGAMRGLEA